MIIGVFPTSHVHLPWCTLPSCCRVEFTTGATDESRLEKGSLTVDIRSNELATGGAGSLFLGTGCASPHGMAQLCVRILGPVECWRKVYYRQVTTSHTVGAGWCSPAATLCCVTAALLSLLFFALSQAARQWVPLLWASGPTGWRSTCCHSSR